MKNITNFNIRVANFIIARLKKFLDQQFRKKKATAQQKWHEQFLTADYIDHFLDNELKIRLYKNSILSKFIYDGFEIDEIDFLNVFLSDGDCFLDIGANVGLFSLYASRKVGPSGTVIAFEPSQTTFNRLLENLELNGLTNVRPCNLGLSDHEEILELNISVNGFEAWNTFVHTNDNKFSKKEYVQVKLLDDFLKENSLDIDKISLIKLDVEGFELNVLKGASELLSRDNAPVFLVEFTDDNSIAAGHCCHEIYKFLNKYGYSWYRYDARQKKLVFDPMRLSYPYENLIAIKNAEKFKGLARFYLQRALDIA